ncbi:MAG: hypothetical protein ABH864_01900 [archaeon]
MEKRVNKKGQDLSIGTLILIVLGTVVLVLLVLGFTMGWDKLWDRINIFGGGSTVSEFGSRCSILLSQGAPGKYDFCYQFEEVTISDEKQYVNCIYGPIRSAYGGTAFDCEDDEVNTEIGKICEKMDDKDRKDTLINGATCHTHFSTVYNNDGEEIEDPDKSFEDLCKEKNTNRILEMVEATTEGECPPKEGTTPPTPGTKITTINKAPPEGKICCDYGVKPAE